MTIIRDEAEGGVKASPDKHHKSDPIPEADSFAERHLGSRDGDIDTMLRALHVESMAQLISEAVPEGIRIGQSLELEAVPREGLSEPETLAELARMAGDNELYRSFLGMGYFSTIVPGVIQRNVLENPAWYTQYTPYQAEISQGRLEALLNFQTMIADLTGLPVANASLLDEATAAAEAMHMCWAIGKQDRRGFFVSRDCHPQTIAVVSTRTEALGIELEIGDPETFDPSGANTAGILVQYPTTDGRIKDYNDICLRAHDAGTLVVAACDLLALVLLRPPGEFGADIAVGSSQRFGVPLGYGGPHAAFLSTREEFKRQIPGRIIGVSHDQQGTPACRMALQTREQHIRREKATSNICTAQVLLAVMAGMYAVYHGPEGLRRIARRVHGLTVALATGLERSGFALGSASFFDTLAVDLGEQSVDAILERAHQAKINLRRLGNHEVGVSLDEATSEADVEELLRIFGASEVAGATLSQMSESSRLPERHQRKSAILTHPVFHQYQTEHEMLRYIKHLESKDLSLVHSMIPLGSCTMKLNATTEMVPISWPGFADIHPFAPPEQAPGYEELFSTLEGWLCEITGFSAASLQPNAGSQGEYTGLLVIRAYHRSRGEAKRNICLIPVSAHGTNPASATMAGLRVVTVSCDDRGNIDLADLRAKADEHRERLAALMVTYPSTNGVFEEGIREICRAVHEAGGQVYLDGANMNAQVGLCRPGDYGADVCHLNLHKTFCIPHGGGGPGMGPICVASHLAPFLPSHPVVAVGGEQAIGAIAAAPWGSAGILPISWAYIALMGSEGLTRASRMAILNANYMAARLGEHYPVLFRGARGRVAHEFIIDLRPFKTTAGIEAEDVAKRLMDYGFHAPTMSFPVAGTLMIEPTESESRAELDRFCDAMIAIRQEISAIEQGEIDESDNPLKNAPHPATVVVEDAWPHPYSRQAAVYPLPRTRERKFWPAVSRIDNAWGDRNLFCTCPLPEESGEVEGDGPSASG